MQTDMHYYGTYAMARASGLMREFAQAIATAAEYVDDSDAVGLELGDRVVVGARPTAHHPLNKANLDIVDQRDVWVPFHFLPGNEGTSVYERLICRRDSALAREMVAHHVAQSGEIGFLPELIGITAHAYADTFSHYGFSGIASPLNHVDPDTIKLTVSNSDVLDYIKNKADDFWQKYVLGIPANIAALGHGAVATFPDRPYLSWSFTYHSDGSSSGTRENQVTFLEACQKLHEVFTTFGQKNPAFVEKAAIRAFDEIRGCVQQILAIEGNMQVRIDAWQNASTSGELFTNAEQIPTYNKTFASEMKIMAGHNSDTIKSTYGYSFLGAAYFHRRYVLDELLPKHGLRLLAPL